MSYYRPISLLPLFSKVFEVIILTRFQSFYCIHLLTNFQYGFTEYCSTSDAIYDVIQAVLNDWAIRSLSVRYTAICPKRSTTDYDYKLIVFVVSGTNHSKKRSLSQTK